MTSIPLHLDRLLAVAQQLDPFRIELCPGQLDGAGEHLVEHNTRPALVQAEQIMSLNELSQLREYALRLLDDCSAGSDIQPLNKTTSAMKLRVSLMAQSTTASLRDREDLTPADAQQLRADASELCYIRSQPTADEIILRSLGVLPTAPT
jgi:hypothetical protein